MNKSKRSHTVIFAIALLLVASLACNFGLQTIETGPLQTDSQSVELGSADSVEVVINMGFGDLSLGGGGSSLMDAEFSYNIEDWQPEVSYQVSDDVGKLTVEQPDVDEVETGIPSNLDDVQYEWNLQFDESVPMDLRVNLGAGQNDLELDDLNLSSANIQTGAGEVTIDASGANLEDLDISVGAGELTVDLSGSWEQDLRADIQGGVGEINIILPSGVGVQATVNKGIGEINSAGLNASGNVYTNDAYGESDITLYLNIEGGIGQINLTVAE